MTQTLRRPILVETTLLVLICLIDTAYTLAIVRLGIAREANPLVAWSLAHSDWMFIGFKMGLTMLVIAVIEHIRSICEPFVKAALRFGIIGYLALYGVGSLILIATRR